MPSFVDKLAEEYGNTPFVNHLRKKGWSQNNAARYYANLLNSVDKRAADTDLVMSSILEKGPGHMIHIDDKPNETYPDRQVILNFRWLKEEYLTDNFKVGDDKANPWGRVGGKTKRRRRNRKSRHAIKRGKSRRY